MKAALSDLMSGFFCAEIVIKSMTSSPGRKTLLFFRSISYLHFDSGTHRLLVDGSLLGGDWRGFYGFPESGRPNIFVGRQKPTQSGSWALASIHAAS